MALATQNNLCTAWALPEFVQDAEQHRCGRIYTHYFNLKAVPFSITPDPEFLFLSETHRSVIEKIQYGVHARMGFMLLTGEVGTGKTTLCRALLDHLNDRVRTVYVINPSLSGRELLAGILDDLGIPYSAEASKKEVIDRLNHFLLASEAERPVIIIVDDAQTMPLETLEDLRLLSNLETDKHKLLQMLLVGQPELLTHLDQPQLRQLKQRVAVNCRLDYLAYDEVSGYIERRLFIAGNQGQVRFSPKAVRQIHRQSRGVPRMINKICDLALTAAYTTNSHVIELPHLRAAGSELIELWGNRRPIHLGRHGKRRLRNTLAAGAALLVAMATGFGAHRYLAHRVSTPGAQPESTASFFESVDPMTGSDQVKPAQIPAVTSPHADGAYVLQLSSFNTLATALRAVDIYSQKGMTPRWTGVQLGDKGYWYRVYVGGFASIEAARRYQNRMGQADAQLLYAPWTVVLEQAATVEHFATTRNRLQRQGVDSFIAPGRNGLLHLCTGAFISEDRAEAIALRIRQQTGIIARVANAQPERISDRPDMPIGTAGDAL